ncbi:V-type proton ATPase subunit G [Brachionus plicatilis]|uniref:V-type proton ATPase subunit G n=1 Tax=Brachionus plicatilis TaxID=10195 RepID=A0A3M7R2S3_BRAPC|nr:V-type proton ATPase subunit G [Brachionus plicatilis]
MTKTENNTACSDGSCIVMLTDAEKRARTVVDAAKKRKIVLMKKAKEESTNEIENFRKQNEQTISKLLKEYSSGQEQNVCHIEENLKSKKALLSEEFKLHQNSTLDFILELVMHVEPKVHGNLLILRDIFSLNVLRKKYEKLHMTILLKRTYLRTDENFSLFAFYFLIHSINN